MTGKLIAGALIALCCNIGVAFAQAPQQPWQGTFTKTFHPGDRSVHFIDLPPPPPGTMLAV